MKRNLTSIAVASANMENRMSNIKEKKIEGKAQDRDRAIDAIFDIIGGMLAYDALNVLTGSLMAIIDTLPAGSQTDVKQQLVDRLTPPPYNR